MRTKLTPGFVLRPPLPEAGRDRIIHWDADAIGFGLQVTAAGHKTYVVQYRVGRTSRRMSLKPGLSLQDARREAKKLLGDIARGQDPLAERRKAERAEAETFEAISRDYVAREGARLRSMGEREAILKRLVYPTLGKRPIEDIRRSDIIKLLDRIEDENGPRMADMVLAIVRRVMSWHASRSDDFRSPIVRGMARTKPKERARQRVLTDDEVRAVWRTAETQHGVYPRLVRFLLLTAARRSEAAGMLRSELADNGTWTIPSLRYKTGLELVVPLSPGAQAILEQSPRIGPKGLVFTTDGKTPFAGFSKAKAAFDKACGVTGWTTHDLRRTARSLMSRAGVDADVAERCLGHVIAGVRGVYDRYAYFEEKRRAFVALDGLLQRIIDPVDNVVALAEVVHG